LTGWKPAPDDPGVIFEGRAEQARRRLGGGLGFRLYLLARLPLAFAAGLRLERLDEQLCQTSLPGGWRTRNPFGSTYFAALCMAAEAASGAPALALASGAPASVAVILREIHAVFNKRVEGHARFEFQDLAGIKAAVDEAAGRDESVSYAAEVVGRGPDGEPAAEFRVVWSFKRRPR
jgi:hypothetical protein